MVHLGGKDAVLRVARHDVARAADRPADRRSVAQIHVDPQLVRHGGGPGRIGTDVVPLGGACVAVGEPQPKPRVAADEVAGPGHRTPDQPGAVVDDDSLLVRRGRGPRVVGAHEVALDGAAAQCLDPGRVALDEVAVSRAGAPRGNARRSTDDDPGVHGVDPDVLVALHPVPGEGDVVGVDVDPLVEVLDAHPADERCLSRDVQAVPGPWSEQDDPGRAARVAAHRDWLGDGRQVGQHDDRRRARPDVEADAVLARRTRAAVARDPAHVRGQDRGSQRAQAVAREFGIAGGRDLDDVADRCRHPRRGDEAGRSKHRDDDRDGEAASARAHRGRACNERHFTVQ